MRTSRSDDRESRRVRVDHRKTDPVAGSDQVKAYVSEDGSSTIQYVGLTA